MPQKSIREMNKLERTHYSLASRTFRATIMGAIVLGLAALILGLGLYSYALGGQYVGEAYNLCRTVSGIIGYAVDVEPLADEVMARYKSIDPARLGDDGYDVTFTSLLVREDYRTAVNTLRVFLDTSDVYDVYIVVFDVEHNTIVYVADPEEESAYSCAPGTWEVSEKAETKKFVEWDGEKMPYTISLTSKYGWLATSGVPLKNAEGETYAYILADVSLGNIISGMKNFFWQYFIAMFLLVNVVALIMARHMKKTLVMPINSIAEAAEKYIADKREGSENSDHFSSLSISTGDEVENLALIMADMEKDLADYEENLTRVTAEKERVGAELSLATRIQADMLPNIFPAFPDRPDFDVYATMTPAKEVGGDFYDFFLIDHDHLAMVMADVSGKGVPAALFMMISKTIVQNLVTSGYSPGNALEKMNEQICSNNREEMFVTVWLGVIDLRTGVLTAANAGHEYPVLKKPDGSFEFFKDKHGFVIGGMAGMKYREYELKFEPGSKLFLYTDGVPESTNENNVLFGNDRMLEALRSAEDKAPDAILGAVADAVMEFSGSAPQFDDVTMLCFEYIGTKKDPEPGMKTLTLDAVTDSITELTNFVDAELEAAGASLKAQTQIDVAIDEIFSNIARYAYTDAGGKATVGIRTTSDPHEAELVFTDEGRPYDPLKAEEPDTTLSADERKIGGLGILIVKKTMDSVSYEHRDGKNVLTIKKKL